MTYSNGRPAPDSTLASTRHTDVDDRLGWAGSQHALGEEVRLPDLLLDLDLQHPGMAAVRRFALETLGTTERAFRSALSAERCRQRLGFRPDTPAEMARAVFGLLGIAVRCDGTMQNSAGNGVVIDGLMRAVRAESANLKLGFHRGDLDDATVAAYNTAKRDRMEEVKAAVLLPLPAAEAEAALRDLEALASKVFEGCPRYAAAHLMATVWQAKRKMMGLQPWDHLMVLLTGRQGSGKSRLLAAFYDCVRELVRTPSFKQVTDERIVDLWTDSFVVFIDEMSGASRACINEVKHAITSETVERRPMGTNRLVRIPNNATFIAATNQESLADNIRDDTGARRFAPIRMRDRSDWDAVNAFDWARLWRAVDPMGDHPMAPHKAALAARQEDEREKSAFEVWLDTLPNEHIAGRLRDRGDRFATADLFDEYSRWESEFFPRLQSSVTAWGRAMVQVEKGGRNPFARYRTAAERGYRWVGQPGERA